MGEYRRFVSYLYEYRNDRKEKIAGAVRVDCRGSRTQIRVDVRESRSPGQAVLLGDGVPAQPLGRVLRSAGAGGERFVWRPESGQPEFYAYSGLEIRYADSTFCLRTFWDDRIAEAEERARKVELEKKEPEERKKEEAEQQEKKEPEKREKIEAKGQEKKEPEQREEEEERKKKEPEQREEEKERKKKEPEKREKREAKEQEKKEPEQREEEKELEKKEPEQREEEVRAESKQSVAEEESKLSEKEAPNRSGAEEEKKEVREQREEENAEQRMPEEVLHTLSFEEVPMEEPRLTWEELSRIYPSVRPFGEADSWEVLRIRLQDIGRLPREYWGWGSCPFVEMAYQDHGSLLLLRDPASEQIYLGVPGTLPLQEFKVAELFGFRWHREGRETGYYLARINL